MTLDRPTAHRRLAVSLALTAATALTLVGCSAPGSPAPGEPGGSTTVETPVESTEGDTEADTGGEPEVPADFPQDIFITDGELLAASGGSDRWEVVKTMQLLDQARVAVDANVTSYGFTIDEFVDGESPSWRISNDSYDVSIDVVDGSPLQVTYIIEAR